MPGSGFFITRISKLSDNFVTDDELGPRTIDTNIPIGTSNTDTVTNQLSKLAKQIKLITGEADWKTIPSVSLSQVSSFYTKKNSNETITGNWTFSNETTFTGGLYLAKQTVDITTSPSWYRFAQSSSTGKNNFSLFEIRYSRSTTSGSVLVLVGIDYNDSNNLNINVLGSSAHQTSGITQIRILRNTTNSQMYLEFYATEGNNTEALQVEVRQLSGYGFTLIPITEGNIPTGYTAHTATCSNAFSINEDTKTFTVTKQGYVGINTTSPTAPLHVVGDAIVTGTITGTLSGNASTATKLQTARTISLTGSVTGSTGFDGSTDISLNTTITNGAVTGDMLASGAVLANLGYTPVNKAGDTMTGPLNINNKRLLHVYVDQDNDTNTRYYYLGRMLDNNGILKVNGILGGHDIIHGRANIDLQLAFRSGFRVDGYIMGTVGSADLLVKDGGDGWAYVYLVTNQWALVNLELSKAGDAEIYYNGTYSTSAPGGTTLYRLSDDFSYYTHRHTIKVKDGGLYTHRYFGLIGDIDEAKWFLYTSDYSTYFFNDHNNTSALPGVPDQSIFGRTYRAKAVFRPWGDLEVAGELRGRYNFTNRFTVEANLGGISDFSVSSSSYFYLKRLHVSVPSEKNLYLRRLRFNLAAGLQARVDGDSYNYTSSSNSGDIVANAIISNSGTANIKLGVYNPTSDSIILSTTHSLWAEFEIV